MAAIYLDRPVCGANGYKKDRNTSGILFVRNLIGKCSAQLPKEEHKKEKILLDY